MTDINEVKILGRLTRDPQLRYLQSGVAVADISVAVNRSFKKKNNEWGEDTAFVDCTFFDSAAETIQENFIKGDKIFLNGCLKWDKWTDKNGNNRSKLYVRANEFFKPEKLANRKNNDGDEKEPF